MGINTADFIQQHLRGHIGVEGDVEIDPLAAANRRQGSPLAHGAPGAGAARVVGRMGRVGVIQYSFVPCHVGFGHEFIEKAACAAASAWQSTGGNS